jgi:ankyrin repeat protein
VNENGNTGFHIACINNYFNIVKLLINNVFDINIQNKKGETGLDNYGKCLNLQEKQEKIFFFKDLYKKESNWRKRKEFIMFLVENKYINNKNNNNINVENNVIGVNNTVINLVIEKVFNLKELDIIITSYL